MFELKNVKAARLWMLPPAAMEVAIELLWEDKLAHPQWPHVFVVPCFMTHMWRRDLGKSADILFTVPVGVPFWGASQFELLTVAIIFPLSHVSSYTGPWAVKGTDLGNTSSGHYRRDSSTPEPFPLPTNQWWPSLGAEDPNHLLRPYEESLEGIQDSPPLPPGTQANYMSWMGHCLVCSAIWKGGHGLFCRNYLLARGNYPPCGSVWCGECYRESQNDNFPRLDHLQSGSDLEVDAAYTQVCYRCGRNGDSFRNVVGRDLEVSDARDKFTLMAIRRVLLDVMWAREPDTVAANWSRSKRAYDMAVANLSLDYHTILPVLGNPLVGDRVGLGMALTMVLASLRPGKNGPHVQFDTIRKTQTWYANAYDAGENFSCKTVVGLDQKKQYISTGHTFGKWFSRFMWGARLRMGMVRRQNEALSSKLVIRICAEAENLWTRARTDTKRLEMEDAVAVCFMLFAFGAGLRGEEVPLVSLEGLLQFWQETREGPTDERYMMMTLSGRFKGEVDSR